MEIDGRDKFGSWFEEYNVGDVFKHWPGRTVNEYDDTLFSMITMNHQPLHIDAHYMKDSQFGQRLVRVRGLAMRNVKSRA